MWSPNERHSGFGGREIRWHGPTNVDDGSVLWVCDSGHGLSGFCTKAFQEWYAVPYSVLSDRILWECMFCCIMWTVSLCMGDLFWRWLCTITSSYVFHLLKEKKNFFFFQFYLTCQKFSIVWASFLPPLLRGVLIFLLFGFFVFFFLAMLHLPKHAGSSVIFLTLVLWADFF